MPVKKYRPSYFVPTTSVSGSESPYIFRGENMWIRIGRDPNNIYAESYAGSQSLSEPIDTATLTGTIAWDSTIDEITGTGTAFLSEIDIGDFVLGDGGANETELLVVKEVKTNTKFIVCKKPITTKSGKTAYNLPGIFAVGSKRGTCVSGNVLQFPKGHFLGVGRGNFCLNGSPLLGTPKTFIDANVNTGTETITVTAHGFLANQPVRLANTGGALPTGLSAATVYYIIYVDANNIQLSLTAGGAAANITAAAGGGTHSIAGALVLSKTPQFALYNPVTDTYTQNDVGIDKPLTPITLAAAAAANTTITNATNATPIVVTTGGNHHLYNNQQINISGVTGNTAANGDWTITWLTATTFSLNGSVGNGAYVAGGTVNGVISQMRAGDYSIRVVAANSQTLGYSNPTEATAPVTLTAGQEIQITFNSAMVDDQDSYHIYATPFKDASTTTILAAYNGPWYLVRTVTATELIDSTHTTGRESGTTLYFSYTDGEIQTSTRILSFNNFAPQDALFVDLINGIPIYFSCLGKGNTAKAQGTSPGPAAIPSKPSNPEAVFLDKAITMAGGDYIVGEFNAKSRIYALGQNTLQTLLLTTLEDEPIAFRSLWNAGFRNPYNVAFVKEYLYGFSTQKIVRSVAGGDDSAMEFEFTADIRDYVNDWETGHVLVGYDPKNRAVCFFHSAAEQRSGYWVTTVLPFMLDKQVWNPPIVLSKANTDFIVSGVATVGNDLTFVAGGRTSGGAISMGTYVFDAADGVELDWYLAWNFTDDEVEWEPKSIRKYAASYFAGANDMTIKTYGQPVSGYIRVSHLEAGTNSVNSFNLNATLLDVDLVRTPPVVVDTVGMVLYAIRLEGTSINGTDRIDELAFEIEGGNATT